MISVKLQFFTLKKHKFDDEILNLNGQLHQKHLPNTFIHNLPKYNKENTPTSVHCVKLPTRKMVALFRLRCAIYITKRSGSEY